MDLIAAANRREVHDVWNACTGDLTLTNGSASVVVRAGETVSVATDGASDFRRVQGTDFGGATLTGVARVAGLAAPSANSDAATKKYVDDTAFAMAGGALPGQAGSAGKFLKTDGSTAGWDYAVTVGGGLATVVDDTVTVTPAPAADVRGGSNTTKSATVGGIYSGLAEVPLAYFGSNIVTSGTTLDNTAFINGAITLTQISTVPNLTAPVVGRVGRIRITQNGATPMTLAFGSNYKFPRNLTPALTLTLGAVAFLDYEVVSPTYIRASLTNMG